MEKRIRYDNYITELRNNVSHGKCSENFLSVSERKEDEDKLNQIIENYKRGDNEYILGQVPLEEGCVEVVELTVDKYIYNKFDDCHRHDKEYS